ncbi:hypothetical protein D3C85_908040 [compost metagenome]
MDRHVLVLVALQVAGFLRLMTQALHAIHDVVGLRQERITQALYPDRILPQRYQHLREGDQRLHAGIPGLVCHLLDRIIALGVRVGLGPGDPLGNLPGVRGGHQYLGQQWVGIQRDGRHHLIQLFLGEHGVFGHRRGGRGGGGRRCLGSGCRRGGPVRSQCQAGRAAQEQYG